MAQRNKQVTAKYYAPKQEGGQVIIAKAYGMDWRLTTKQNKPLVSSSVTFSPNV